MAGLECDVSVMECYCNFLRWFHLGAHNTAYGGKSR